MKKNMITIKLLCAISFSCIFIILAAACGNSISNASNAKDGVYEGIYKNEDDSNSSSMTVTLTIKDGKIIDASLQEFDSTGKLKDENYGKNSGDKNYAIAQRAVKATKTYPALLIEKQDLNDIDAVSGATVSYKLFKSAVADALAKAEK